MDTNYKLQFSRSKFIETSRAIAVLRLNEYEFSSGEPVIISYYKDQDFRTDIGTIFAIGIKSGKGEDCYRLIETGGSVPVRDVVEALPDVSKLVHGELYIYHNTEKDEWNYVYKKDDEVNRKIELITGGPFIFVDLESGYRWFYSDQTCRREDDFLSTSQIKEVLSEIVKNDVGFTVINNSGSVFKVGDVKNINLELSATRNNEDVTNSSEFFCNDQRIESNYVISNVTKDTNFILSVKIPVGYGIYLYLEKTIQIKFGYDCFYGLIDNDWKPSVDNIKSLEHKEINIKNSVTWTEINLDYQKLAFAYPKQYGLLEHIYDYHGIDYINDYDVWSDNYIIDKVEYYVYIKKEAVEVSNFKQEYSFSDNTSSDIDALSKLITGAEGEGLSDILQAWKNRNSKNGLLKLTADGKLPEDLTKDIISTGTVFIKEFVNSAPQSGLTVGDVYYITTLNKIFTATSKTSGIISSPEENILYVLQTSHIFYYWNGQNMQPMNYIGSRKITDITEIL